MTHGISTCAERATLADTSILVVHTTVGTTTNNTHGTYEFLRRGSKVETAEARKTGTYDVVPVTEVGLLSSWLLCGPCCV